MSESPYIFEGTPENFQELVIDKSGEVPVLVDFWASWCAPCQMLLPIVTQLAGEYQGKFILVKVNTDEQQALAAQFGVRSLPTLKLFWHGEVVEEIMGAQPEPALRQMLDQYVEAEENPLVSRAHEHLQAGEYQQARELMTQALEAEPGNQQIALDLIRLIVIMDDIETAESMIKELPRELRESDDVKEIQSQIQFAAIIRQSPEPATLEQKIQSDPGDLTSRHQLAAWRVTQGQYEQALSLLMEIMKKQPGWQDGTARKDMLAIFELIPGEAELVSKYRRQMFNLLH